jgi:hypothetical protein
LILLAELSEAFGLDREPEQTQPKTPKVKAEKFGRFPIVLARSKIVEDQPAKIEGSRNKKDKSGTPDHNETDGKVNHFRFASLTSFALRLAQVPLTAHPGNTQELLRSLVTHTPRGDRLPLSANT